MESAWRMRPPGACPQAPMRLRHPSSTLWSVFSTLDTPSIYPPRPSVDRHPDPRPASQLPSPRTHSNPRSGEDPRARLAPCNTTGRYPDIRPRWPVRQTLSVPTHAPRLKHLTDLTLASLLCLSCRLYRFLHGTATLVVPDTCPVPIWPIVRPIGNVGPDPISAAIPHFWGSIAV